MQAFGIGTLTDPVKLMIDAGIPVIDMDTHIAPWQLVDIRGSVTQTLCDAIGGKRTMIMIQGALGHTGAQGRARGFEAALAKYPDIKVLDDQPADWDVTFGGLGVRGALNDGLDHVDIDTFLQVLIRRLILFLALIINVYGERLRFRWADMAVG
ncbi:hypothetical protein SAMN07250955_107116 [Arboricoccus pini]|uniref:Uncharacterized protein n=1 Tax=Arboricoccus pini TaxID=1963835 RepID=A0A212RDB4_9PROT|nr:hypothetical protein SAMN07250955_107116 [Arboricoccus pini]